MIVARNVIPFADWSQSVAADTITLDHDGRHRRRIALISDGGIAFLLDLAKAIMLQDGDGIILEDGRIITVRAANEPLLHIEAGPQTTLARLSWHIGNRHLAAVIADNHILIREDYVIAAMLCRLGATVTHVKAPFTPEPGAYSPDAGHNNHGHEHHHEHHQHAH